MSDEVTNPDGTVTEPVVEPTSPEAKPKANVTTPPKDNPDTDWK